MIKACGDVEWLISDIISERRRPNLCLEGSQRKANFLRRGLWD